MAHDRLRSFKIHVFNPMTLKMAGRTHCPFALVYHTGRRSGKAYRTPLIAQPMGDDFVFALTYGSEVDWYRNILAAGRCTLLRKGKEYNLEKPESLDQEKALLAFPRLLRSILRMNKIHHFFRMQRMDG